MIDGYRMWDYDRKMLSETTGPISNDGLDKANYDYIRSQGRTNQRDDGVMEGRQYKAASEKDHNEQGEEDETRDNVTNKT